MSCHMLLRSVAVATAFAAAAAPSLAAPLYTFTNFVDPANPTFTEALGINNSGTVVGFSGGATAQGFVRMPAGSVKPSFGPPGATSNMVTGINAAGAVSGIFTNAAGTTEGYTLTGKAFASVNQPGTVFNQELGIANNNETVGYASATDPMGIFGQKAYSQQNGVFTDVNKLLPINFDSQATGINNNASEIVGFYQPTPNTSTGFIAIGGVISNLDPFGSSFVQPLGVNDSGEVVGFYLDAAGNQHGFVDIGGTVSSLDPAGSLSTTISGVNDLGQLVGFDTQPNDTVVSFVATPTPVPEPASLALLAVGTVGLTALRRRRRYAP